MNRRHLLFIEPDNSSSENDMKQIRLINLISVNVDQNNDFASVSHIPQFQDTNASPTEDVDVSAGDAHLQISGYVTLLMIVFLI
jgi:hypothetical protein